VSGKVDMISFYTDSSCSACATRTRRRRAAIAFGGTLWGVPERYLDQSAILHADRIKTPL
jgi:dipeptidyl aminopeptidase/acylaminoacyl peptidase